MSSNSIGCSIVLGVYRKYQSPKYGVVFHDQAVLIVYGVDSANNQSVSLIESCIRIERIALEKIH